MSLPLGHRDETVEEYHSHRGRQPDGTWCWGHSEIAHWRRDPEEWVLQHGRRLHPSLPPTYPGPTGDHLSLGLMAQDAIQAYCCRPEKLLKDNFRHEYMPTWERPRVTVCPEEVNWGKNGTTKAATAWLGDLPEGVVGVGSEEQGHALIERSRLAWANKERAWREQWLPIVWNVRRNTLAMDMLRKVTDFEPTLRAYVKPFGAYIQTMPDLVGPGFIADIKTTSSDPRTDYWWRDSRKWGYDIQGALAQRMWQIVNKEKLPFYLIVCMTKRPWAVQVVEIQQACMDAAIDESESICHEIHESARTGWIIKKRQVAKEIY